MCYARHGSFCIVNGLFLLRRQIKCQFWTTYKNDEINKNCCVGKLYARTNEHKQREREREFRAKMHKIQNNCYIYRRMCAFSIRLSSPEFNFPLYGSVVHAIALQQYKSMDGLFCWREEKTKRWINRQLICPTHAPNFDWNHWIWRIIIEIDNR